MVATKPIPLLDLKAQYATIREEVRAAIDRVAESQYFILGGEVEKFEREVAAYCGTAHAVGCASGSDALLLALMALGIGEGDEVITVPYSFFATAGEIHHCRATPVFADVDPHTFNLDVAQLEAVLDAHPKARAILPVHLYGGCADMDPIRELARKRGIAVIEDAAQAIGSEYKGRRAGTLADIGCFSFFPSKNLGAFGDGGMVTTDDADLAERIRALRVHGSRVKYYYDYIGLNSRLDALQAAILSVKLRHLDAWSEGRRRNAELYRKLLAGSPVRCLEPAAYQSRHIYNQFVICCPQRDELRAHLAKNGIGTEIYYPLPLHLQKCFAHLGYRAGDFPVSERLARESMALPIYAELAVDDIETVARTIQDFFRPC